MNNNKPFSPKKYTNELTKSFYQNHFITFFPARIYTSFTVVPGLDPCISS